jgi:hypothetical protein
MTTYYFGTSAAGAGDGTTADNKALWSDGLSDPAPADATWHFVDGGSISLAGAGPGRLNTRLAAGDLTLTADAALTITFDNSADITLGTNTFTVGANVTLSLGASQMFNCGVGSALVIAGTVSRSGDAPLATSATGANLNLEVQSGATLGPKFTELVEGFDPTTGSAPPPVTRVVIAGSASMSNLGSFSCAPTDVTSSLSGNITVNRTLEHGSLQLGGSWAASAHTVALGNNQGGDCSAATLHGNCFDAAAGRSLTITLAGSFQTHPSPFVRTTSRTAQLDLDGSSPITGSTLRFTGPFVLWPGLDFSLLSGSDRIFSCNTQGAMAFSRMLDNYTKIGMGASQKLQREDSKSAKLWGTQLVMAHGNPSDTVKTATFSATKGATGSTLWEHLTTSGSEEVATFGASGTLDDDVTTWGADQKHFIREMLITSCARGSATGSYSYNVEVEVTGDGGSTGITYTFPVSVTQSFSPTSAGSSGDARITSISIAGGVVTPAALDNGSEYQYTAVATEDIEHTVDYVTADTGNLAADSWEVVISNPTVAQNGALGVTPSTIASSTIATTSGGLTGVKYSDNLYDADNSEWVASRTFNIDLRLKSTFAGSNIVLSSRTILVKYNQDDGWAPNTHPLGTIQGDETATGDANVFAPTGAGFVAPTDYDATLGYRMVPLLNNGFDGTAAPTSVVWRRRDATTGFAQDADTLGQAKTLDESRRLMFGMYWRAAHVVNGSSSAPVAHGNLTVDLDLTSAGAGWNIRNAWAVYGADSVVDAGSTFSSISTDALKRDPVHLFETYIGTDDAKYNDTDSGTRTTLALGNAGRYNAGKLQVQLGDGADLSNYILFLWELEPADAWTATTGAMTGTATAWVSGSTSATEDDILIDGAEAAAVTQNFKYYAQPGVTVHQHEIADGKRYLLQGHKPVESLTALDATGLEYTVTGNSGNGSFTQAFRPIGAQSGAGSFGPAQRTILAEISLFQQGTTTQIGSTAAPAGADTAMGNSASYAVAADSFGTSGNDAASDAWISRTAFAANTPSTGWYQSTFTVPVAKVNRPDAEFTLRMQAPLGDLVTSSGTEAYDTNVYGFQKVKIVTDIPVDVTGSRQDRHASAAVRTSDLRPLVQFQLGYHPVEFGGSTTSGKFNLVATDGDGNVQSDVGFLLSSDPTDGTDNAGGWAAGSDFLTPATQISVQDANYNKYHTVALDLSSPNWAPTAQVKVYIVSVSPNSPYSADGLSTADTTLGGSNAWLIGTFNTDGIQQIADSGAVTSVARQYLGNDYRWRVKGDALYLQYAAYDGDYYKWFDGPSFDPFTSANSATGGWAAGTYKGGDGNRFEETKTYSYGTVTISSPAKNDVSTTTANRSSATPYYEAVAAGNPDPVLAKGSANDFILRVKNRGSLDADNDYILAVSGGNNGTRNFFVKIYTGTNSHSSSGPDWQSFSIRVYKTDGTTVVPNANDTIHWMIHGEDAQTLEVNYSDGFTFEMYLVSTAAPEPTPVAFVGAP